MRIVRNAILIALLGSLPMFSACASHVHVVGRGSVQQTEIERRQWYILWGLVPLNQVDTRKLAADEENYEIKTDYTFIDMMVNAALVYTTISTRTVKIRK